MLPSFAVAAAAGMDYPMEGAHPTRLAAVVALACVCRSPGYTLAFPASFHPCLYHWPRYSPTSDESKLSALQRQVFSLLRLLSQAVTSLCPHLRFREAHMSPAISKPAAAVGKFL